MIVFFLGHLLVTILAIPWFMMVLLMCWNVRNITNYKYIHPRSRKASGPVPGTEGFCEYL